MTRLSVILWLWSERTGPAHRYKGLHDYGVEHVRRMTASIHANLAAEHEVVCITDYPAEAFAGIRCRVMDLREHFGELRRMGGCWLRLRAFAADMADIIGPRLCWIDLDSVVTGQLDPLLCRPEPLVLLKLDSVPNTPWNGSMALWSPAETDYIWRRFDPVTSPQIAREQGFKGTDQSWLSMVCDPVRTPHWDMRDGVLHYSLHVGRRLPEHARIVTWPGRLKPDNPSVLRRATWLPDYLDGQDPPAPTDLRPWSVDKPMKYVMQKHRPTMQDIRRERRAMQRLQER